ncbi:putative glucose-6-phosphate isomerase [Enterospora canceri]|uniref:Glucose-6-phosphate isomerase n=1 Tax=Enterospora canceri TaxID=1081671 RepID=A0A1Y1S9A7_9MICR|nr:putative glucose-6-phosphate isomerase [Enterospora canceri]
MVEEEKKNLRTKEFDFMVNKEDRVFYDYTKTHLTESETGEIKNKLIELDLCKRIMEMHLGRNVNFTEQLPELHYLLRGKVTPNKDAVKSDSSKTDSFDTDGFRKEVEGVLDEMKSFEEEFDNLRSATGRKFKYIFNLGIGGSDLGPKLINSALHCYKKRTVYFFSNVDSSNLFLQLDLLLEAGESLQEIMEQSFFIVVSKSWTTTETLNNINLILEMCQTVGIDINDVIEKQVVAVTSKTDAFIDFRESKGIRIKTFKMADFICGRYSLWSAVGLSIVLGIGYDNFTRLLNGAHQADIDFFTNQIESVAVHAAVVEIYYNKITTKCYASYDSHLSLLPFYLQQAEMESNGKLYSRQKIVWGGIGTDVQHSFFQYLHQNDNISYLEMLVPLENQYINKYPNMINTIKKHHDILISNCLAQTKTHWFGNSANADETIEVITNEFNKSFKNKAIDDHVDIKLLKESITSNTGIDLSQIVKSPNHLIREIITNATKMHHKGNRPSTTIAYTKLSPEVLGFILGIYEHKIFVEGVYWGCCSFDQFGVKLGKKAATEIEQNSEGVSKKWIIR